MQVDELLPFLRENQESLIQEIREGKYKPTPVRRVEIPKETKGEFRKLGVPTVVDRVLFCKLNDAPVVTLNDAVTV